MPGAHFAALQDLHVRQHEPRRRCARAERPGCLHLVDQLHGRRARHQQPVQPQIGRPEGAGPLRRARTALRRVVAARELARLRDDAPRSLSDGAVFNARLQSLGAALERFRDERHERRSRSE